MHQPDSSDGLTAIRFLATVLRLVTAAYAVLLVVATHIPRVDVSFAAGSIVPPDKLLHFAAYGVLGFLVGLLAAGSALNWRQWFPIVLAAIALFALLDESTQPMFGRAAEPFDWVADVIGAAIGLIVAAGCAASAGFSSQALMVTEKSPRSLNPME
jgi:VanZ family protein